MNKGVNICIILLISVISKTFSLISVFKVRITLYVSNKKNSKITSWMMNIDYPDKTSEVYQQFIDLITNKVHMAMIWLDNKHIEYVWNYQVDNHLYRIYIPCKDVLLDFEWFPVINTNFNYVRVDFLTDIENVLEKLFPETILETTDLEVWKLNQRAANHFLREQNISPVYDKDMLRLAWVKDGVIYQCIVLQNDRVIRNTTRKNCSIKFGTYILLRYLTEVFGYSAILLSVNNDNSFTDTMYRLIGATKVSQTIKRKIWWNPSGAKWRIKREDYNKYIPFYFSECVVYRYQR